MKIVKNRWQLFAYDKSKKMSEQNQWLSIGDHVMVKGIDNTYEIKDISDYYVNITNVDSGIVLQIEPVAIEMVKMK